MKKRPVDFGHMLSGIRMDVWLKLLRENKVDKEFYPQAAVITLESAVLTPLAYLEYLLFWIPVHFTKIKKRPDLCNRVLEKRNDLSTESVDQRSAVRLV